MDMIAFDSVRQLAASHYLVRSLHVAAELGVADAVGNQPRDVSEIAAELGANEDALFRMLVLLASRGIFRLSERTVTHSPASEFLRADHPASLKSFVRMFAQPIQWQTASELLHAVQSGEAAATRVFPEGGFWGYLRANPGEARVFGEAMVAKSAAQIADVLATVDFDRFPHIVDVGGGHGHLLRAILARYPKVSGSLFDLPAVIDEARGMGANDRLGFVPGDFFGTALPEGDAVVLMEVLHDWDDARCAQILAAARRAMAPQSRLFVIEIEMVDGDAPDWPKLLDIVMLSLFGARQRTNAEYRKLLEGNLFSVERQVSTPGGLTIIEAVPTF